MSLIVGTEDRDDFGSAAEPVFGETAPTGWGIADISALNGANPGGGIVVSSGPCVTCGRIGSVSGSQPAEIHR